MDTFSSSASVCGVSTDAGSDAGPGSGSDSIPGSETATDPFLDGAGFFPGLPVGYDDTAGRSAAVVGGAMAGLGAAHALSRAGYDVALYERQSYGGKRVNCGEAITDASLIPV